jgi:hypothetical protein
MLTRSQWMHRLNQEIHEVTECGDYDWTDKERFLVDIRKSIQSLQKLMEEDHA